MNESTQHSSSITTMGHTRIAILLVVLAYILIYLVALGHRPMAIPDEARYGEIPREMLVTGNWAVPHLVGLRYFEKPPMGYWLNAFSISLFGENIFAVRLPSALSMGLTAWFIWLLLIRTGYGQRAALTAAIVFLSIAEVLIVGTLAVLDNPFTMFLSGGMVLFYLASRDIDTSQQQRWHLIGSGALFGLAFLSKGFLAIALPGLVLLPYCLWQKRYKLLLRQSGWVVLSTLLVVLPWAIIIHVREPDFWRYFIMEEHIRRFLADNAQHAAPIYEYLVILPGAMFPWLAFVPAALSGFRLNQKHADMFRYALLWFALPFLFFSISKGKLATYILPCMIPAAILVGVGLLNYYQAGRRRLIVLGVVINTLLLLLGLAVLLYSQYHDSGHPIYMAEESIKVVTMISGLLLAILLTLAAGFFTIPRFSIPAIASSMAITFFLLNLSLPNSILDNKSPKAPFEEVAANLAPDTILVSDANVVRAIAWTFKRTDIYLLARGELTYGLSHPDHSERMLGIPGLRKLLAQQKSGEVKRDIAVFCEQPCRSDLISLFDEHARQFSTSVFTIWQVRYAD
jgi:4-amino-4-deoxy-L-arabinose transferase